MRTDVTQEVKTEIDRNLSLRAELPELINKIKSANGVKELNGDDFDALRNEFRTRKYSFDDLSRYVANLVSDKRITENDGTLIVQAVCAVNDESEEYFLDDSHDLKARIKELYIEINSLTKDERTEYFNSVRNDKYSAYIYQRAAALIGTHNPFLGD